MDVKVPDISARELLLHPLDVLHQMFTAFLPGVLVLLLLVHKHSVFVSRFMQDTGMLGYKSKIAAVLFVALIVGKVVQSLALAIATLIGALMNLKKSKKSAGKEQSLDSSPLIEGGDGENLEKAGAQGKHIDTNVVSQSDRNKTASKETEDATRQFFLSLLMGTVLARDGSAFDSWKAARAQIGLLLNSGIVLLIAACYKGDDLRLVEALAGVALVAAALIEARKLDAMRMEAIGNAVGRVIADHTVKENVEILQMTSRILPVISKHINPTPEEQVPAQIVDQVVKSASKDNSSTHVGNRKQRRQR